MTEVDRNQHSLKGFYSESLPDMPTPFRCPPFACTLHRPCKDVLAVTEQPQTNSRLQKHKGGSLIYSNYVLHSSAHLNITMTNGARFKNTGQVAKHIKVYDCAVSKLVSRAPCLPRHSLEESSQFMPLHTP